MIDWYWLLVPTVAVVLLYVAWRLAVQDRNKAVFTVQMVELEYRLMAQNNAMFCKIEEAHEQLVELIEQKNKEGKLWGR